MSGWIPDFLLQVRTPVFVEVKPTLVFLEDVAQKIDASGCPEEALLVGLGPQVGLLGVQYSPDYEGPWCLGWLRQSFPPNEWNKEQGWAAGRAARAWPRTASTLLGFCHAVHIFNDRITGGYDGGRYGDCWNHEHDRAVKIAWREAGNRVQWKPRR